MSETTHAGAIPLGVTVRDKITGFTGLAVSRTENLHAETTVGVYPSKSSKEMDFFGGYNNFAETRLEIVQSSAKPRRSAAADAAVSSEPKRPRRPRA